MSTPDYDVAYNWKRGEKTGWNTIGHAFVEENGSIKIYLNSTPIPALEKNPGSLTLYPKKVAK